MARPKITDDPRTSKLIGIFLIFLSLYLFVACTSYIFTWREDQDKVWQFEWGLLSQDISVANWLGRLGAIVSHFLMYWMFGLPSFLLIYLIAVYGYAIINEKDLKQYRLELRVISLWVAGLSILLGFLFYSADFPWGGNFGRSLSGWLMNFVGVVGMALLILFIMAFLIILAHNPTLKDVTLQNALPQLRDGILSFWDDRFQSVETKKAVRKMRRTSGKKTPTYSDADDELEDEDIQDDIEIKMKTEAPHSLAPVKAGERTAIEEALNLPPGVPPPNLSFDSVVGGATIAGVLPSGEKKPVLKTGGAELEIETTLNTPKVPDLFPDDTKSPSGLQGDLFKEKPYGDISTPYDPTLDLSTYEYPVLPLLDNYEDNKVEIDRAELESNKDQIIETLLNYKIEIIKIRATVGPTVTLYEIIPAAGVRISRIKNLEDDIALSLAALGIRIIAPIPGRGTIGIEVPNKQKQIVSLREVLSSERFRRTDMDLPIALGKTIQNEVFVADLAKMPHLLIAGATGQGKSVGINTVLCSLLYKKHPSQLKLVLIDPKKVELSPYSKIESHFLAYLPDQLEPIITDTSQVVKTLNSLVIEMDQRYDLLKKAQARNIKEYNEKFIARRLNPEKGHRYLPFIVLVIDEFADLIMTAGKEVELPIGRLAQLARAVGIHLIIATQRPSVNIITGVIKANFPARLAFKVASKVDSRTILDSNGADQLIGRGDMLLTAGSDIVRLQCAFVDTPEVERVINFIADQPGYATPYFLPEFVGEDTIHSPGAVDVNDLDDMIDDAARLVVQNQHGSTSMIQRRLKLGYNRAGRIMDQLEHLGIVGPNEGSKPREVLFHDDAELERFLGNLHAKKYG